MDNQVSERMSDSDRCEIFDEIAFTLGQDVKHASDIASKLTSAESSACASWNQQIANLPDTAGSYQSYSIEKAVIEMQMRQGICMPTSPTDQTCVRQSNPVVISSAHDVGMLSRIDETVQTMMSTMPPSSLIPVRDIAGRNDAISSLCDSYATITDPSGQFEVILCATKNPPASTFASPETANKICSTYRNAYVPLVTQTAQTNDSEGKADSDFFYHMFACVGTEGASKSSSGYRQAFEDMLDALKNSTSATFKSGTGTDLIPEGDAEKLLGDACPCSIARQMAPFACQTIQNMASDAAAPGADTSTAKALGLPQDDDTSSVLNYLRGSGPTSLKCEDYKTDPDIAKINTCGKMCEKQVTLKDMSCDHHCMQYFVRSGAPVALAHLYNPVTFAVGIGEIERAKWQTKAFCRLCHLRNEHHGGFWGKVREIGLDVAAYGMEALSAATGEPMLLTCGDCPAAWDCMNKIDEGKIKDHPTDPTKWGFDRCDWT